MAFLLLLTWSSGCVPPPPEPEYAGVVVDLNDPTSRLIYEHQNARATDSLLAYLPHPNPSYRYLAARAFGSFPTLTQAAADSLLARLNDPEDLVARAAAYALGQAADADVLPKMLAAFDQSTARGDFNRTLLAAAGKLGDTQTLADLTAVTTYVPTDTALNEGQLQALFYLLRKNVRSAAGDSLAMARMLDERQTRQARRWAAWYVRRAPFAAPGRTPALRTLLARAGDPELRVAAARALGENPEPTARVALGKALENDGDWRVRVEALKALRGGTYAEVRDRIGERLRDDNAMVRRAAADYFLENGTPTDATFYRKLARDSSTAPDVRYPLYAAANRHLPLYLTDFRGRINYDLQRAFERETDPYLRADILRALAEFPWNYRNIFNLYEAARSPAVRTAAAEALAVISGREDFDSFFRGSAARVRVDLSTYFQAMIVGGEVGPAYHAAGAVAATPEPYRALYPERGWLQKTLDDYELPRGLEAYVAVQEAMAALNETKVANPPVQRLEAKAIDWARIGTDGEREIIVRTSVGKLTLRLFPDAAPASVSAFLELVAEGYYAGKRFHRVVPNFVAQGGGPLGDGFGAEDWYLRTETPGLSWDRPGLVGLASAGKDTEGVQFFITHRPTPHLDGNYTIFGEVTEGMDVLAEIGVGTVIESISL